MIKAICFCFLSLSLLFSCAPGISVVSCSRQVHYPGSQESEPFQVIEVTLDNPDGYQVDSLAYGNQRLSAKGEGPVYRFKAQGTEPEAFIQIYYLRKNNLRHIDIDSIRVLNAVYLP